MKSDKPKVLHELLNTPMLGLSLNTFQSMGLLDIKIIAGHGYDVLAERYPEYERQMILQEKQLGTGHALQVAWPYLKSSPAKWVIVANGDTPLITSDQITQLLEGVNRHNAQVGLLSLTVKDPGGYGRVVKDEQGELQAVVEARDWDSNKYGAYSGEVNSGIYAFSKSALEELLFLLDNKNEQHEFYITQLISLAKSRDLKLFSSCAGASPELLGINSPAELVEQEEYLRLKIVKRLLNSGVIIRSSGQVRIGAEVSIEPGSEITGPCEIYGSSIISACTRIDSHTYIQDSVLEGCHILPFCHIQGSKVGFGATVGPYARLRPGTELKKRARAGNFVELKNSILGESSKANHLSYIGDASVGCNVNIGAGTITCNYDGIKKHKTQISDDVFIGSNTALVAPVNIGSNSMVGAGSTITADIPAQCLSVARARQKNLPGKNPLKKR